MKNYWKSKIKYLRIRFKIQDSIICGKDISTFLKTVPLIKWVEIDVVLQNVIFSKE